MKIAIKYGDCIRCGWCCLDMPCGLATGMKCEHLAQNNNGQYRCTQYPFDHLDDFTRLCLEPGTGCSNPENKLYLPLFKKLKEEN